MLDYIFLDLDGPLLDGKQKHYTLYKDLIYNGNGNPIPKDEYWELKRDKVSRRVILDESKYCHTYETFMDEWLKNIESDEYLKFDELKPDVHQTLISWKNYAHKIILVTMRHNFDKLMKQLEILNILSYLDEVIMCDSLEGISKYDMVKHFTFNNAVFIGDTEEDIMTAKKMDIPAIGITNGIRNGRFLETNYLEKEIRDINLSIFL